MVKRISEWILKLFGWTLVMGIPNDVKKCVLIMAPHTSNWDFVIGRLCFNIIEIPGKFLIKKESFFWPLGIILKKMGGIPVDRSRNNNVIKEVSQLFPKYDRLFITITPEGTRKLTHNWKKGFYHIAELAKVPIAVAFVDYKKKEAGIAYMFEPTGDFDKDFKEISKLYYNKTAKFPEKFNLSPMYQNNQSSN